MGFQYHHLEDADVRQTMVELWSAEWEDMHSSGHPRGCYGKQLTDEGWENYGSVMPVALSEQDDDWLRAEMADPAFWMPKYPRRKPKGGFTMVEYNKRDALERLCFGEFNIAYIRGLATTLLVRGETECIVYRADLAYEPRGECSEWEGEQFPLQDVVDGHRIRYWPLGQGQQGAFSIPTGPNCHHSIHAVGVA
jgi:hypothetical protein